MSESASTYRVSARFLTNLCQQAFYGSVGATVSWILFWILSQQILPSQASSSFWDWIFSPTETISHLFPHQDRELIRCLAGPGMAMAALFGGLMDFLTWAFVRYEIQEKALVMRWIGWSRRLEWDV